MPAGVITPTATRRMVLPMDATVTPQRCQGHEIGSPVTHHEGTVHARLNADPPGVSAPQAGALGDVPLQIAAVPASDGWWDDVKTYQERVWPHEGMRRRGDRPRGGHSDPSGWG